MKKIVYGFILAFLYTGCSNQPPIELPPHIEALENLTVYTDDEEPAYQIQLERDQAFGDTDEVLIGNPDRLVVDDSGRVIIGDTQNRTIHIFQPDGSYSASVGREGEGPGEFRFIGNMQLLSDELFVFDVNQRRLTVFAFSPGLHAVPEFSHTINIDGESERLAEEGYLAPGLHSVRNDGSLLLSARSSPFIYRENPDAQGYVQYYLMDRDGNISDKIFEQRLSGHIVTEWFTIPPPFYGRGLMAVSGDDRIFSAWSDDLLIKVHDSGGIYQRAIYHPFTRSTLTREEAINSMDDHEQLHDAVRNMQLPETWPALNRILIDDENRIWAAAIVDDREVYNWWILDDHGELSACFTWPRNRAVLLVKNGHLYTREPDAETGFQHIVRYRIYLDA